MCHIHVIANHALRVCLTPDIFNDLSDIGSTFVAAMFCVPAAATLLYTLCKTITTLCIYVPTVKALPFRVVVVKALACQNPTSRPASVKHITAK